MKNLIILILASTLYHVNHVACDELTLLNPRMSSTYVNPANPLTNREADNVLVDNIDFDMDISYDWGIYNDGWCSGTENETEPYSWWMADFDLPGYTVHMGMILPRNTHIE